MQCGEQTFHCHPVNCCADDLGYVVERVRSRHQEHVDIQGMLTLCGLPARLAGPLRLCGAQVVQIAPVGCGCDGHAFCLTLRCHVIDACGRQACGEAEMTVSLRRLPPACGGCLRLGATVALEEARFCAPCSFFVCARVCLLVVLSGEAHMTLCGACPPPCPHLPLYPPPAPRRLNAAFSRHGR